MIKQNINPYSQMTITSCNAFWKNLIGFIIAKQSPPYTGTPSQAHLFSQFSASSVAFQAVSPLLSGDSCLTCSPVVSQIWRLWHDQPWRRGEDIQTSQVMGLRKQAQRTSSTRREVLGVNCQA